MATRRLELHPPTMAEFKEFVRKIVSAPKKEIDAALAARKRKVRHRTKG